MVMLAKRYDVKMPAKLLRSYLEVVTPPGIKGVSEVSSGIQKWEGKLALLKGLHNAVFDEALKLAIFVGMLPRDIQEPIFQNGGLMGEKLEYDKVKDCLQPCSTQG